MDVGQILAQHVRILKDVEALQEIAVAPRPLNIEALANRRWSFTRDVLLHCSRMESTVLAPLATDLRPVAVARAKIASAAIADFVAFFRKHAERWQGFPPVEHWEDYRIAAGTLASRIRALIEHEASEIVPLLPVQPSGTPPPRAKDHYVSEAWDLRRMIFADDQTPHE